MCIIGTSFWGGYYKYVPSRTDYPNPPPPSNLTIMFGIKNVVIKRHFADFVINSEVGKVLTKIVIRVKNKFVRLSDLGSKM